MGDLDGFFPSRGIIKSSVQLPVNYGLQSTLVSGQPVDAQKIRRFAGLVGFFYFVSFFCHHIVIAENQIKVNAFLYHLFHNPSGPVPVPLARFGIDNLHIGVASQNFSKSFSAFNGRRRTVQSPDFNNLTTSIEQFGCVSSGLKSNLVVVSSNVSGILVRVDFAVNDNHRNSHLVNLFNNGRNGFRLVGRDDQ
ncbi:hypothetical protein NC99_17240 [Sunxiuqinia dokdonensis]|uniref:Uncharacterized protein n=1 Tax=Sunxiuqinia dokdonensis TaxID=1409788 RepID=A0A0L8VAS8_9BACT|nr:hypothetical protein NC99_17240 [Sunxiuqinia dokdonensis]